jgi:hypothetical protein
VRVCVFTGPTIRADEAREVLDAVYHPPAMQGDVLRAVWGGADVVGIVDGYFDSGPAVWHKEILWAMREGVHVFGSASMGALRAAELAVFGMEGVGADFAAYARGELEDDDEVALLHGPEDTGYRALSEPMVNIRATLASAGEGGVITPGTRDALLVIAKALHYTERSYPAVLARGAEVGLSHHELGRLAAWLPSGRVDQKKQDAMTMLRVIAGRLAAGLERKRVDYEVAPSKYWNRAMRAAAEPVGETPRGGFDLRAALRSAIAKGKRPAS